MSDAAIGRCRVAVLPWSGCWPAACRGRTARAPQEAPATVPLSDLAGVTLQVGDQKGGTESLLRAAGALDDLPYKVAFSTFTSGSAADRGRHRGQDRLRDHRQHAADLRRGVQREGQGGFGLRRRRDRATRSWCTPIRRSRSIADLRGKRIAVGKGSSAHGHILGQLEKAGLTPADVKLVFLQPADALSAFTQRQADAWAIWDPYTAQAEAAAAGAQHRPGQGRHQRLLVRRRVRSGAGRPEAQHRAAGPAGALREGGAMGAGPPPAVGAELRRRGRPRSEGRRGRRRGAACGCRPSWTTRWSHPSRSWPTCSPHSGQIAAPPEVRRLGRPPLQRRASSPC